MVAFAVTTGFAASGCPRRATVVPPDPIPQLPAVAPPSVTRIPRRRLPPLPRRLPDVTLNPWKPKVKARKWTSIVIHHTATSRGSVAAIHAAHLKRKDANGRRWRGIGYHFVIGNGAGMPDGAIEPTFRWRTQLHGAHAGNRKHNEHGIGIALVGNFEKHRPTRAQLAAVKRLVATMKNSYNIAAKNVVGHKSIRATACPGRFFPLAEVSEAGTQYEFANRRQPAPNDRASLVSVKDLQP